MDIVIFEPLTTNDYLNELQAESEKYQGLYVDMNEKEQRKYVKDKADHINQLLKKVDRFRIDSAKDYKTRVESEAADIKERLEIANAPFTLLIDEYKAGRKKILDAEKAEKDARLLAAQIECDHEFGLLMNDKFDSDKIAALAEKAAYEQKLKDEAAAQARLEAEQQAKESEARIEREKQAAIEAQAKAEQDAINAIEREKRAAIDAEIKRERDVEAARQAEILRQQQQIAAEKAEAERKAADVEHVRAINSAALNDLMTLGLSENNAKAVIAAIAKNTITNITINY